jgi:hypothetical protein
LLMFQYWMYKYINTVMSFVTQGRHGSKLYLDPSHLYGFSSVYCQTDEWILLVQLLLLSYIGQPLRHTCLRLRKKLGSWVMSKTSAQ